MDAERADRISRLAGLDRVAQPSRNQTASNAGSAATTNPPQPYQPQAYFDANNTPQIMRERSTVGSASATGSVGGRTTWASGSDVYGGEDKNSEDMDVDTESMGGFSDEGASLVGFGEGARTPARQLSAVGSPTPSAISKAGGVAPPPQAVGVGSSVSAIPPGLRQSALPPSPMSAHTTSSSVEAQRQDARMIDGMTYDPDIVDTANRTPPRIDAEDGELPTAAQRRLPERRLRSSGAVP
jgi:hypothetical protein